MKYFLSNLSKYIRYVKMKMKWANQLNTRCVQKVSFSGVLKIQHPLFRYVRLLCDSCIFIHVIGRCKRNAAERCDAELILSSIRQDGACVLKSVVLRCSRYANARSERSGKCNFFVTRSRRLLINHNRA